MSPEWPIVELIARQSAIAVIIALTVTGCASTPNGASPSSTAETPASFSRERLIGRWGVASFHTDKDRPRTEREAKAQCSLPYTIAKGPTDGVMMHVADDPKLYELRLKGDAAGRTYLGFEAPQAIHRTARSFPPRTISSPCASSIRTRTGATARSCTCAVVPDG